MFSKKMFSTSLLAASLCSPLLAADKPAAASADNSSQANSAFDQLVDRVINREAENRKSTEQYNPIAETYIQRFHPVKEVGEAPEGDDYFIGRVAFAEGTKVRSMNARTSWWQKVVGEPIGKFNGDGFSQMVQIDERGLDRAHYNFEFVGREFLGELRCIVLDV